MVEHLRRLVQNPRARVMGSPAARGEPAHPLRGGEVGEFSIARPPIRGPSRVPESARHFVEGETVKRRTRSQPIRVIESGVRGLISLAIAAGALFVILSQGYGAVEQRWAFAAVGAVMGYWFKR